MCIDQGISAALQHLIYSGVINVHSHMGYPLDVAHVTAMHRCDEWVSEAESSLKQRTFQRIEHIPS